MSTIYDPFNEDHAFMGAQEFAGGDICHNSDITGKPMNPAKDLAHALAGLGHELDQAGRIDLDEEDIR